MSSAPERVEAAARAAGLDIDVKTFPEGTRTAEDAARAVGCDVAQIVKSLVFVADGEPVIAYVSGRHKLDTAKLARAAGAAEVRRATADEAREATGYAIGGTPPFGHARPLRLFMDETLAAFGDAEVWCAAGTPQTVFALAAEALLKATGARVENLHEEA
jgi:Cys-tRNA(Pro) deacylase